MFNAFFAFSLVCFPEHSEEMRQAREALYSEQYAEADGHVLNARRLCPTDPESYELRTGLLVLKTKQALKAAGGKRKDCAECESLILEFEKDFEKGRALADAALQHNLKDERLMFLSGKLYLNRVWMNVDILDKAASSGGPYRDARDRIEEVLKRNPRHIRALVASAWINYMIASRSVATRALLRAFGIKGDKKKAFDHLALAVAEHGDEYSHWEAKFTQRDLLKRENKRSEVEAVTEELRTRFPKNGTLNGTKK
jgi:hypothetical protein